MKELKSVPMSFRFAPSFKECLAKAAKQEARSQANFIERLVFDYCEKHGITPKPAKSSKGGGK